MNSLILGLIIFLIYKVCKVHSHGILSCRIHNETSRYIHHTPESKEYIQDASSFYPNLRTYFIVHGWNNDIKTDDQLISIADKLIANEACNVILVDYAEFAARPYTCAHKMVKAVGEHFGNFLVHAVEGQYIDPINTHIITHSLGGHVAGFAARMLQKTTGQTIHRISALDPAGPLFKSKYFPGNNVLTANDATVVDILHCTVVFGQTKPLGTVDFYARGLLGSQYAILQRPCLLRPFNIGCSRQICKEYYSESITSCGIQATTMEGDDIVVYGHHMDESITGVFEFTPKYKPPYGRYDTDCEDLSAPSEFRLERLQAVNGVEQLSLSIQGTNIFDCEVTNEASRFIRVILDGQFYIDDAHELTPNVSTYFLFHGWNDNVTTPTYYTMMAQHLLTNETCNVLLVDYQYYAKEFYTCAHVIVKSVGKSVGEFIADATQKGHLNPDRIHFIGQSLGAHVAGAAGRSFYKLSGKKIRRISGLDPAGPLFQEDTINNGLRPTDAKVVDVLHCAITFGTHQRLGTVDFYASGITGAMFAVLQKPCIFEPFDVVCSHKMAKRYYDESINSCGFKANEINGKGVAIYGHHMDESTTGIYLFDTGYHPPYGKFDPNCFEL